MKRIVSLLLGAVLLAGTVPMVQGADMTASRDCLALLKQEEGFDEYPYWDYGQWTVGYGTRCPGDRLEHYGTSGIDEQAAEALLQSHLSGLYTELNRFADKYSLEWTQNQFDALVLFSYNCGTGWIYEQNGIFHNAIRQMATGNDLIGSFALWCGAGGQIREYLLRRRLCEANIWLNAVYSQQPPEDYCYVFYDANGGTVSSGSQGYHGTITAEPALLPTYPGHTFLGWYTQKMGGDRVTVLDKTIHGKTLYAHWILIGPCKAARIAANASAAGAVSFERK